MNYSIISGIQFWFRGYTEHDPLSGQERRNSEHQVQSGREKAIMRSEKGLLDSFSSSRKRSMTKASVEKITLTGHLRPNSKTGWELL